MLLPENRALLTTALRPPVGYSLDRAVATTYSLDLIALMTTQLTFAAHGYESDVDSVGSIALLDSIRSNANKTTVFVQGGGIHVPTRYRPLLALLEDSVVEVAAPREGALFHPKVWVLRYVDPSGVKTHRVLVLSRNLTFDRSWDTLLRLDEVPQAAAGGIQGGDFADFVAALPGLANSSRPVDLDDLDTTLRGASFRLPEGFDDAEVLALFGDMPFDLDWSVRRALLISPFLGKATVARLAANVKELRILSTAQALDGLGASPSHVRCFTLAPTAEIAPEQIDTEPDAASTAPDELSQVATEVTPPPIGLHAKVLMLEDGRDAWVCTGSANATTGSFQRNVELMVEMHGPRSVCGIDASWDGKPGTPGLASMVAPYTPRSRSVEDEIREDLDWQLASHHAELAALDITTAIVSLDDETFAQITEVPVPVPAVGASTTVRPLTRREPRYAVALQVAMRWEPLGQASLTPFVVVRSRLSRDGVAVVRECVLRTRLIDDIPERLDLVLREILKTKDDVLAYLAFLLGDAATDHAPMEAMILEKLAGTSKEPRDLSPVILFEPLVRAALGNPEALHRVGSLVSDLVRMGETEKLPEGFLPLWEIAREVGRMS